MTADDLDGFLAYVRGEAAARLARLDAVDTALIPPELRAEFEQNAQPMARLPDDD